VVVLSVKNIIYFRFSQLFIKKGFFFLVLRIYNRYSIHGIYLKMVVQVKVQVQLFFCIVFFFFFGEGGGGVKHYYFYQR
jgi:hypothetical protein